MPCAAVFAVIHPRVLSEQVRTYWINQLCPGAVASVLDDFTRVARDHKRSAGLIDGDRQLLSHPACRLTPVRDASRPRPRVVNVFVN